MSSKTSKDKIKLELQKGKVCAITKDPSVQEICNIAYDEVGRYISEGRIDISTGNSIPVVTGAGKRKSSKKLSKKSSKKRSKKQRKTCRR